MLILFYHQFWGRSMKVPPDVPRDVEITGDRRRYGESDAVVFHIPEWTSWRLRKWPHWQRLLVPKKQPGQLWVAWSLESEENYPALRDAGFMRHFDLTMTYRRSADIPVTYADSYRSAASSAGPTAPKRSSPLVTSFISSPHNGGGRERFTRELARHLDIDAYGTFMRNQYPANDSGRPFKLETIARYKFTLAFENTCAQDYVTEKFFEPLGVGSVPVYLGAPNVEAFAPGDHCFVNVGDFSSPGALAAYLTRVGQDENAYRAYFAWKERPLRPSFQELMALGEASAVSRLCQAVRARLAK